jgi:Gpi18-like mannosyltransferase
MIAVRAWVSASDERQGLARILGYLVLTRLVLFVVAASAIRILPADLEPRSRAYLGRNLSLATWLRWDAWWYLSIVEQGYWYDSQGKSNVAFFPLFPGLIKALAAVTGNPVAVGFLVTNAAAVAGVVVFWRWVRAQAGAEAAERAVLWLLVYPFSFFFHTLYAEALFFLLATLALFAAWRERWLAAGAWGALAAATRPMGVLLCPAFAWGLWRAWRAGQRVGAAEVAGASRLRAGAYVSPLGRVRGAGLSECALARLEVRFQ